MKPVTDFLANAKGLTKNPLGIIALFISMIYGIAGFVLTISNNTLDINQNWVLIWFIVSFPVLILIAFIYLVVMHHQKLYSPSDYKDEHNFFRPLNTFEREQKLKEDIDLITDEQQPEVEEKSTKEVQPNIEIEVEDKQNTNESTDLNKKKSSALEELKKTSMNFAATVGNFYFLIEELVLRRLESELRVPVSRQMALDTNKTTAQFDGVAFKKDETIGIEIKYINFNISSETVQQIRNLINNVISNKEMNNKFRFIFVFVSDKPIVNLSRAINSIKSGFENEIMIDVRHYDLEELKNNNK